MLRVRLFGGVGFRSSDSTEHEGPTEGAEYTPLAREQTRRLFAYLALHAGQRVARQTVWQELWGHHGESSLKSCLTLLRGELGAEYLPKGRGPLFLRSLDPANVDALYFLSLAERALETRDPGDFDRALAVVDGAVLSDLPADESSAGARWVQKQQQRFARVIDDATRDLIEALLASGRDPSRAIRLSRDRYEADPDNQPALRQLMKSLAHAGELQEAVLVCEQFGRREPDAPLQRETATLVAELQLRVAPPPRPNRSKRRAVATAQLRRLIGRHEWRLGATNFDEDLHFSTHYTRQSCQKYLPEHLRQFGYTTLVAIYEDFKESYYLPEAECERVAQELLSHILERPSWLQDQLDEIGRRLITLQSVFPYPDDRAAPFAAVTDDELGQLYHRHHEAHTALYQVARLPEALDRGINHFTTYLKGHLRGRNSKFASDAHYFTQVFEDLTFPEQPSDHAVHEAEFTEVLRAVEAAVDRSRNVTGRALRLQLHMDPALLARVERFKDEWYFWGYHGYASRATRDLNYYLDRIAGHLSGGRTTFDAARYARQLEETERRRIRWFDQFGIDEVHQQLFRLYARVGVTKLHRRSVQLRNFVFLDQMIAEIARRRAVQEGIVRCLLPEEVKALIAGDLSPTDEHAARKDLAVHVIDGHEENVFAGTNFSWLSQELDAATRGEGADARLVPGDTICEGVVRGRARVIIRRSDADDVNFRPGDILVSEATDSDLLEIIQKAGGVLTEAGGATCHAAIVCREMGKPSLMGIDDLLRIVKNDDFLIVNADEGFFSILDLAREYTWDDTTLADHPDTPAGPKAKTLAQLLHAGTNVPRFFAVLWKTLIEEVQRPADADALGPKGLHPELSAALEYLNGELFMIRSSMNDEDSRTSAGAGRYQTWSSVERQDLLPSLLRFAEETVGIEGPSLEGSVIVQEMVLGEVSGTCFTQDPRSTAQDAVLLEAVPGGNEPLTEGRVVPARYAIDREAPDHLIEEDLGPWGRLLAAEQASRIAAKCLEIEQLLGRPQDIEWTLKDNQLFILQSRPITGYRPQVADSSRPPPADPGARAILDIYRTYRVPPSLRQHLFRVTAVAEFIMEHCRDRQSLDRDAIRSTLLIHDIGNIVKADYDRFPSLAPEEQRDLGHWKAVRDTTIARYGTNDHEVTLEIAKELQVSPRVLELLGRKRFVLNCDTAAAADQELKICAYADQRVSPTGILPLRERLHEARNRYAGILDASVNDPKYPQLFDCAMVIESQIAEQMNVPVDDITDFAIEQYLEELRGCRLPVHQSSA